MDTHLLQFHENGKHVCCEYRRERLVEKTKQISTTIAKSKLPRFTDQPNKMPSTVEKENIEVSSKDMSETHRNMEIVKEQGMDIRQLLTVACAVCISTVRL